MGVLGLPEFKQLYCSLPHNNLFMSEDTEHEDGEQFDTELDESATDGASTIGDDEENKKVNLSADEIRKQSIASWKDKIAKGEKTLEDIPPAQKWIKDALEVKEKKPQKPQGKIEESELNSLLDKREDEKAFKALKAQFDSAKLSPAEKKAVTHEYEELRRDGGMKGKSLSRALKLAGVRLKKDNAPPVNAGRIPLASNAEEGADEEDTPFNEEGQYDLTKGTSESRLRYMESQRAQGVAGTNVAPKAYQRFRRK